MFAMSIAMAMAMSTMWVLWLLMFMTATCRVMDLMFNHVWPLEVEITFGMLVGWMMRLLIMMHRVGLFVVMSLRRRMIMYLVLVHLLMVMHWVGLFVVMSMWMWRSLLVMVMWHRLVMRMLKHFYIRALMDDYISMFSARMERSI